MSRQRHPPQLTAGIVNLGEFDAAAVADLSNPIHGVQNCRYLASTPENRGAAIADEDVPCYPSAAGSQVLATSRTIDRLAIHQKGAAC